MTQKAMYPTIMGDYSTPLTAPYLAGTDTTIQVADTSFLPAAQNTATIMLADQTFLVTVKYTGKTATTLTGITVVQGTPGAATSATFPAGSLLSKPLTQDDIQTIQDNISDLATTTAAKLDKNQGAQHAGKVLKVGADGEVTPQTGGGGVSDYEDLENKPKINNTELTGNKSLADIGAEPTITKKDAFNCDFGSAAGTVCEGNDSRLSNARAPTTHAATHADGGSDEITIAEAQVTGLVSDLAAKQNAITAAAKLSADLVTDTDATNKFYHTHASTHGDGGADEITIDESQVTNLTTHLDGKQPTIDATHKLGADLIDDTNATNKFYHTHAATHNKNGGDEISLDASQVTSGIFSADRIPALAYQRMVTVADETAKDALTSDDVSVGDTVYVQAGNKLYIVSAITGAGTASEHIDYVIYTAYVSWNSVTGKPESFTPATHAGSHVGSGTDAIREANTAQNGLISAADWNTFNAKQPAITSASKLGADLVDDTNATNKFCTAAEKISWTGKQDAITSASKLSADLTADGTTNKVYTSAEQTKLSGIESGAQVNVKPDWNATAGTSAEILNKPSTEVWTFTLTGGTTVTKNVYVGGN